MTTQAMDGAGAIRHDVKRLEGTLRKAGVPSKLLASIHRKCLRTPRRQTGRPDRRTNREPRWALSPDHPDYASDSNARLVYLKLLLDMLGMQNAPLIDQALATELRGRYLAETTNDTLGVDPLTDEPLNYLDLIEDVVGRPKHGYSKFHIGHQDPKLQPKHVPSNIRWQLKASNDFQGTMDIRVARIAYLTDQFTRTGDSRLIDAAQRALACLRENRAPNNAADLSIELA